MLGFFFTYFPWTGSQFRHIILRITDPVAFKYDTYVFCYFLHTYSNTSGGFPTLGMEIQLTESSPTWVLYHQYKQHLQDKDMPRGPRMETHLTVASP